MVVEKLLITLSPVAYASRVFVASKIFYLTTIFSKLIINSKHLMIKFSNYKREITAAVKEVLRKRRLFCL
jgi:hypothetical protein